MSIITKKGDRGITSLYRGGRVSKDNIRCEVCGVLDELSSYLGLAKSLIEDREIKKLIRLIQKDLFVIGSEVATRPKFVSALKEKLNLSSLNKLEKALQKLESKMRNNKRSFYIFDKNPVSCILNVARTIVRKVERRLVTLNKKSRLRNKYILPYINRLSDLLFLIAYLFEKVPHKGRCKI